MRRLTLEEFKERLRNVHGVLVDVNPATYINSRIKAEFIDKDYGTWAAKPNSVLNGCRHPSRHKVSSKVKVSIEEIERRLKEHFGDLVAIKPETYKSTQKKAIFVDKEFGEWSAAVYSVVSNKRMHPKRGRINQAESFKKLDQKAIREKVRKTNLERYGIDCALRDKERKKTGMIKRYGVEHPMQHLETQQKAAKNSNNTYLMLHWKTGEELACKGTWERDAVSYLNKNKANYRWQPKFFDLPNGKRYLPDLLLEDSNIWVEIKGRWLNGAREKWDLFVADNPNSELWDKNKLHELGIKVR